ncbi:MAG: fructose-bisphosphate aldolase [Chloroflexota bacterium]|nr:MAG: fructose-bisphosphate aldolase [Chloroflexota bacterium]
MARVNLNTLPISTGKKARLHRILYEHGPGNGTALLLPIDHGLEHGPIDFLDNPDALNPEWELRLAKEAGYSGIVFQIGIAEKYMRDFAGEVPLILKLNGRTNVPSEEYALSPLNATVEDAVRLGADAVGYTLYVGSPLQADDLAQFRRVRSDCDRYAMPLIVWAYPRGKAIEEKGGRDSLYAIDYAARAAAELGADMVKVNVPKFEDARMGQLPKPYSNMRMSMTDAIAKVVQSASGVPVLISGGSKLGDEDLLNRARASLESGACGLIFGRNIFQRPYPQALEISRRIAEMMRQTKSEGTAF